MVESKCKYLLYQKEKPIVRKVISVISLVLVLMFMVSVPTVATDNDAWIPPEGVGVVYATDLGNKEPPLIDGNIGADEYGKVAFVQEEPIKLAEKWPDYVYIIDDNSTRPASGTIEFYFAYDETSVYVAFKEYSKEFDDGNANYANYSMRDNYGIEFGLDLNDLTNYFLHVVTYGNSCWDKDFRISEGKSSNFSKIDTKPHDFYSELFVNKYPASQANMSDAERDVYAYGDVLSAANTNSKEPYILEVEMRIDKDNAIELYNSLAYTNYAYFPNAMYFSLGTHVYRGATDGSSSALQGYSKYLATDIRDKTDGQYFNYGLLPGTPRDILPYLVVFGDENTVITVPKDTSEVEPDSTEAEEVVTEPVLTEPVATEPVATEPTATEPATTEPAAEGGCGGTVTFAGLALVAALGACTVFGAKKKED